MFSWKIPDHLLDMSIRDKRGSTIALVRIDHETGKVVHSGTNYAGTALTGAWDLEADGGPKLDARFASSEGGSGNLMMQFQLHGDDEMILAIKLGPQATSNIRMVRGSGR